ncbi:hypothetical protein [Sinorhizobium chiapasense]|uniref:Transposase n=1 Tax=Sinorhizobium chiapasense TaxID=501572 RepID=A0ABZ2BFZ8_9HYPH
MVKWSAVVAVFLGNMGSIQREIRLSFITRDRVRRNLLRISNRLAVGVPTISDRALQRSTAEVLSAIYEQDFLPCSFGGRPKLSAHHALSTLDEVIAGGRISIAGNLQSLLKVYRVTERYWCRSYAVAVGMAAALPGTLSTRSKNGIRYCDRSCGFRIKRCKHSPCCEPNAESVVPEIRTLRSAGTGGG